MRLKNALKALTAPFRPSAPPLPPVPMYARKGETITCEKGHEIAEFLVDVPLGSRMDLPNQLGHWRQRAPPLGEPIITAGRCAHCGSFFCTGLVFHIGRAWRDPLGHGYLERKALDKFINERESEPT